MGGYSASLMLPGDKRPLPATLQLNDGRFSIDAADQQIGEWGVKEVEFERIASGFRARVEGEEIILEMTEAAAFEEALSQWTKKRRRSKRERAPKDKTPKDKTPKAEVQAKAIPTEKPARDRSESEPAEPGQFRKKALEIVDRIIASAEKRYGPLLPDWVFTRRTVALLGLALVLAVIFPGVAATALLFAGLAIVVFGAVLYTDDTMATRMLPGRATATHVLITGVGVLVFGFLLAVLFG